MIDAEISGVGDVVQTRNSKVAENYHHGKLAAMNRGQKG